MNEQGDELLADRRLMTDERGERVIADLAPGSYVLALADLGIEGEVTVAPGETAEARLAVEDRKRGS